MHRRQNSQFQLGQNRSDRALSCGLASRPDGYWFAMANLSTECIEDKILNFNWDKIGQTGPCPADWHPGLMDIGLLWQTFQRNASKTKFSNSIGTKSVRPGL